MDKEKDYIALEPPGEGARHTPREPENDASQWPCSQCGAKLVYAPGTSTMLCRYCGTRNEILIALEGVEEEDYEAALLTVDEQPQVERSVVSCDQCGAEIDRPPLLDAMDCPYCGANLVMVEHSARQIRPKAVLPFFITHDQARKCYQVWLSRLWFAPRELKKHTRLQDKLQGIYVPYWTYDARTGTHYKGRRGDDHTVWKTRTVYRNGKAETESYTETETRWSFASGFVRDAFDDVLVIASRALPVKHARKLEPWDLRNLQPYSDEYISGFLAQSYQVDLADGFAIARAIMDEHIRRHIRRDIGGDHQRITWKHTKYEAITYKHILLPIWICAYRYRDRSYVFLVNGRTGEVQGERPWSFWKITMLVAVIVVVVLLLVLLFGGALSR